MGYARSFGHQPGAIFGGSLAPVCTVLLVTVLIASDYSEAQKLTPQCACFCVVHYMRKG